MLYYPVRVVKQHVDSYLEFQAIIIVASPVHSPKIRKYDLFSELLLIKNFSNLFRSPCVDRNLLLQLKSILQITYEVKIDMHRMN